MSKIQGGWWRRRRRRKKRRKWRWRLRKQKVFEGHFRPKTSGLTLEDVVKPDLCPRNRLMKTVNIASESSVLTVFVVFVCLSCNFPFKWLQTNWTSTKSDCVFICIRWETCLIQFNLRFSLGVLLIFIFLSRLQENSSRLEVKVCTFSPGLCTFDSLRKTCASTLTCPALICTICLATGWWKVVANTSFFFFL